MSEKARGAIFNTLGSIEGLDVLDAYAGSGALAFEAISRGASAALLVEIDRQALITAEKNVTELGILSRTKIVGANISTWCDHHQDMIFDIVFGDPPYNKVQPSALEKLAQHAKPGGVVVFSLPPGLDFGLDPLHYEFLTTKNYGDAQIVFYRKLPRS